MEKETCISEKILRITAEDPRDFLEEVSALASRELGVKIWFCERIGRRWSHFAGDGVIMSSGIRGDIPGVERMGYILESKPEDQTAWEKILRSISERLNTGQ